MNVKTMKFNYCQKTIEIPLYYGSYKDGCGKPAVAVDSHGRSLCEKHYNQWLKRVNKHESKVTKKT